MISPELADSLSANSPREKYLLTTCSGTKETKYGRRVSGLLAKSMSDRVVKLPNLIECDHIPQDKTEIPPLDNDAKVNILIGRDAPELLKVRAFKNGPKGAPWAQKLMLGWTVSGQMCLDRVGGPVHISANYTALHASTTVPVTETEIEHQNDTNTNPNNLAEVQTFSCPNYFEVKRKLNECCEETETDVYKTTPEDNESSMSWEDRQSIKIMEKGIHKNKSGNWAIPLPFRSQEVVMPNNQEQAADDGEEDYGDDVKKFIHKDFYVDDGLTSQPSNEDAIKLVKGAQSTLAAANLRLHKVASNSVAVMEAFPADDRAKNVRDLDLRQDTLPAQRTLGLQWNLATDTLTFSVHLPEKPFTRRGVLSVVNSIYDALGLAAPVILVGKLLLQKLVIIGKKNQKDKPLRWDDPLPDDLKLRWRCWKDDLAALENVHTERCYHPLNFGHVTRSELHAFSDASKDAIGAAMYLKQINEDGEANISLAFGQCKVAPIHPTSIPRLELCAAVMATQAVKRLETELDIQIHNVTFYTDSRVVLGYIKNNVRRFHVYVANRVQAIRDASKPEQWKYIETSINPADLATHGITVKVLLESDWLSGPHFLKLESPTPSPDDEQGDIDENDPEVRKQISAYATSSQNPPGLGSERFSCFSKWYTLQRAITNLIARAKRCKVKLDPGTQPGAQETANKTPTLDAIKRATALIIQTVQLDAFAPEINVLEKENNNEQENRKLLRQRRTALRKSSLYRLDPFVDKDGVLRVGGRLHRSDLAWEERHPIILPKKHHVSELLIRHYHHRVHHQGRQITHGALRQGGYWIIGGQGMVAKILNACVTCRKLRGRTATQKMADLPADRTEPSPPFTNVGMDVFGPWMIKTRRLRGSAAESKRWALVFYVS